MKTSHYNTRQEDTDMEVKWSNEPFSLIHCYVWAPYHVPLYEGHVSLQEIKVIDCSLAWILLNYLETITVTPSGLCSLNTVTKRFKLSWFRSGMNNRFAKLPRKKERQHDFWSKLLLVIPVSNFHKKSQACRDCQNAAVVCCLPLAPSLTIFLW